MKKNRLLFFGSSSFYAMIAIISCTLFSFLATTANAQASASVAPAPPISTEDFPQETTWKSNNDYSTVLESERAIAAQKLSSPNTKELEFALYTGYDRMLSYMQVDLVSGLPIEKIAEKNFVQVNQESNTDPALEHLDAAGFSALYSALLVMLQQ